MADQKHYSIITMELGPMENFIYLIIDNKSKNAAVVDPAWDVNAIIAKAKEHQVNITDILLTHSHHDHINGLDELLMHYDAEIHLTHAEAKFWGSTQIKPTLHYGGANMKLGETEIQILHTPGHTPGSACYYIDDQLITGDTLFVYGCGRCDLKGGDPNEMYDTLRKLKIDLPAETNTLPGHNYSTKPSCSWLEQIQSNPFMHYLNDSDKFTKFRMHTHDHKREDPMSPISKDDMSRFE